MPIDLIYDEVEKVKKISPAHDMKANVTRKPFESMGTRQRMQGAWRRWQLSLKRTSVG